MLNIKMSRISELEIQLKNTSIAPEMRMNQLIHENKVLQQELESMEKELNDAIEAQHEMEEEMEHTLNNVDEQEMESISVGDDNDGDSFGVVNDMVVSRLKSNISDLEDNHVAELKKLEEQLAMKDAKIAELHGVIVNTRTNSSGEGHFDDFKKLEELQLIMKQHTKITELQDFNDVNWITTKITSLIYSVSSYITIQK